MRSEAPFVPRPDPRGAFAEEWDEQVAVYRAWIESERTSLTDGGKRRETAEELLRLAGVASNRIERGIAGPEDPDRRTVDLLFFPTGGGKTEAYLGLPAFAMVFRRLRNPGGKGRAGAGVSVVMRYTLRLLTLDQLARAAGLVCALELEREKGVERYGEWPFEIGLWVGKAATPNILGRKGDGRSDSARAKTRQFKSDPRGKPSPIPLENCPWCGARFEPESFALLPDDDRPRELRVVCADFESGFTRGRPLPIVAVDEPLYRRLPAFLIATVDKFASLPWVGHAGMLLGGATRYEGSGFYGSAEPSQGTRLEAPLPPPDLIIQDELHLIAGPLGTMVGLYEAAIEALCVRTSNGTEVRPKIVASTATVRRARDQIQALFGRPETQIFPPPGPDRRDSFFAETVLGYFNSLRELGGARRIIEEQIQNRRSARLVDPRRLGLRIQRNRRAVSAVRALSGATASARGARQGLRIRSPPEVSGESVAARRRTRGQPLSQGARRNSTGGSVMKAHIDVVCPHTLVIAEAFREWEESRREIDLPAVDKDANLVVIELNDERGPVLRADDSRRTAS